MNDDHRSVDEIERDIERKRANIGAGIAELQDRLSPEAIVTDAKSVLQQNFAEISDPIAGAARSNPLAVALIGVGLVWLFTSANQTSATKIRRPYKEPLPKLHAEPDWLRHDGIKPRPSVSSRSPTSFQPRPAWADSSNKEF
jgi:hypothetical protein